MNIKLNKILSKQKVLEKCINKIKIDFEETNINEAFANVIKFYIYIAKLLYVY